MYNCLFPSHSEQEMNTNNTQTKEKIIETQPKKGKKELSPPDYDFREISKGKVTNSSTVLIIKMVNGKETFIVGQASRPDYHL